MTLRGFDEVVLHRLLVPVVAAIVPPEDELVELHQFWNPWLAVRIHDGRPDSQYSFTRSGPSPSIFNRRVKKTATSHFEGLQARQFIRTSGFEQDARCRRVRLQILLERGERVSEWYSSDPESMQTFSFGGESWAASAVASRVPGETLSLTVVRGEERKTLRAKLGARPDAPETNP